MTTTGAADEREAGAERMPAEAFHPGEYLADEIAEWHFTPKNVLRLLGWTAEELADVLDGRADITPKRSADLARMFGVSAGFWLRLQAMFDRWKAHQSALYAVVLTPPAASTAGTRADGREE